MAGRTRPLRPDTNRCWPVAVSSSSCTKDLTVEDLGVVVVAAAAAAAVVVVDVVVDVVAAALPQQPLGVEPACCCTSQPVARISVSSRYPEWATREG